MSWLSRRAMCSSNQMNHFPRLATICSERSVCKNFSNRTREVFIGFRRIFQNENFLKPMGSLDAGGLSPQFLTIKLGGDGGVTVLTLQPEFLLTLLILLQSQSLAQHQALCVPWSPLSMPFLHAQFLLPGMLSLPLQVSNSPTPFHFINFTSISLASLFFLKNTLTAAASGLLYVLLLLPGVCSHRYSHDVCSSSYFP